jgi:MFS family permease
VTIQAETTPGKVTPQDGGAGRWSATAVFFLNGLTLSTFIVRLPALREDHNLTDGQLGMIGVLFAVAALACMQFVGMLSARVGSKRVLRVSLVLMPLLLAAVGLAGSPVTYAAAATALGGVHGITDAAMNAHAVTIERRIGRPILNGCHAAWSISAVVASVGTVALATAHVSTSTHLVAVAALLLAGGIALGPLLVTTTAVRGAATTQARPRRRWRNGWTRAVVILGLTGTALMVCEAAALGWGGVLMRDAKGASLSVAAAAIAAYTAGQTGGRFVGDRLTMRFGSPPVFRAGALIAAGGLALAVAAPSPAAAILGFAVMGLGGSVLVPLAFSAAGRADPNEPNAAEAVSRFTTFTYSGILLGPGAIGWSAEVIGLTATMAALIPVLAVIGLASRLGRSSPGS